MLQDDHGLARIAGSGVGMAGAIRHSLRGSQPDFLVCPADLGPP